MVFKNYKKHSGFILIMLITAFINFNCSKKGDEKSSDKSLTFLDTVAVKTVKAGLSDIRLVKTFTGSLEGEEQANIVSKISERIMAIKVHVGDNVKSGQLLILLDKSGASSQFYQAQAGFLNAEKELNRMKALYEGGAISQQLYDGTKTSYDVSKANFEAAKNTVELTSPINGVVTAINPNVGDLANPGMPLITVASINKMKVLFDAGEEDVAGFAIGQSSEIYSELKPQLIQKGTISQISRSATVESRSFEVRAVFQNTSDRWFKPGMFCRVNVELKNKKGVLAIPNAAITVIQNNSSIYVISGGKASLRKVETGITDGKMTEILSGISNGEFVATLGINNLKDGSNVHISE
jgi:RND family efflux transporter MFP subunit